MYIFDTNVLIYELKGKFTEVFENNTVFDNRGEHSISIITAIEILSYPKLTAKELSGINELLNITDIININQQIAEKTASIRRTYKTKLADAIIAASALENDMALVSRNDKDFSRIKDLRYINPFD